MSLVFLEGWGWGMQSLELQDHPAGSGISSSECYQPYLKFPERAQANMGFEKWLQMSLLGNSQRNSLSTTVDGLPPLQQDIAIAGAWRMLPPMASVLGHPSQNMGVRQVVRSIATNMMHPWTQECCCDGEVVHVACQ